MWEILLRRIKNFLEVAQLIGTAILRVQCLICLGELLSVRSVVLGQAITTMSFSNQLQYCFSNLGTFFTFKIKFNIFIFFDFEVVEILI